MNKNAKQLSIVLIAFLISQLLLAGVLAFSGKSYFKTDNWRRYDSDHYISIAEKVYELFPCDYQDFSNKETEYCGNTGWYPGYPYLLKLFSIISNDTELNGGLLSKVFYFLSLLLLLKIAGIHKFSLHSFLFILIAAFFFGFIYYNAVFPLSAVICFALASLYFYIKEKYHVAGLFCLLTAVFYPSGFLLGAVYGLNAFLRKDFQYKHLLLFPAYTMAGVVLVCINFQVIVGDWTAFAKVQAKYGHSFNNPVSNLLAWIFNSPYLREGEIRIFIYIQALLVFLAAILLSIAVFKRKMLKDPINRWVYIYFIIYFIFEWSIAGGLSMYRSDALLLPTVLLLKDFNQRVLIPVLIVLLLIGIPMSHLFFEKILV